MPFPHAKACQLASEYGYVDSEEKAEAISAEVGRMAARFDMDEREPLKPATVIYLALCRLKFLIENKRQKECRELFAKAFDRIGPWVEKSDHSVNCSHFSERNVAKDDAKINHARALTRACNAFMAGTKARKKRCLALLIIGLGHTDDVPVPQDDSWVQSYVF